MTKVNSSVACLGVVFGVCIGATSASAISVFVNDVQPGSQSDYVLGMDFVVNTPILVTDLGVFDDNGDGTPAGQRTTVGIYELSALQQVPVGTLLVSETFGAGEGTLIDGSLFKSITPLVLGPGNYSIVAAGFGLVNMSGNSGHGGTASFNDLGGALSLVADGGRWDTGSTFALPTANYGGYSQSDPVFLAGTFSATSVADGGSTLILIGLALAGVPCLRRRLG